MRECEEITTGASWQRRGRYGVRDVVERLTCSEVDVRAAIKKQDNLGPSPCYMSCFSFPLAKAICKGKTPEGCQIRCQILYLAPYPMPTSDVSIRVLLRITESDAVDRDDQYNQYYLN